MENQLWYINADTLESENWPLRVKGDMDQCFDSHTKYVETLNSILETKEESHMMGITYNWCGRSINSLSYGIVEDLKIEV
jgi:hypothetical protein